MLQGFQTKGSYCWPEHSLFYFLPCYSIFCKGSKIILWQCINNSRAGLPGENQSLLLPSPALGQPCARTGHLCSMKNLHHVHPFEPHQKCPQALVSELLTAAPVPSARNYCASSAVVHLALLPTVTFHENDLEALSQLRREQSWNIIPCTPNPPLHPCWPCSSFFFVASTTLA